MATWSARISTGADDAQWLLGNSSFSASSFFNYAGGWLNGTVQQANSFLRYVNITIPKDSTINSAIVTFQSSGSAFTHTVNSRICAIAADNAPAPDSFASAVGATRTTAFVDWSAIAAWVGSTYYDSPDIATVVQEIVNRSGWESGNAIVLYFEDNGTTEASNTYRRGYSYDSSPSACPLLTIDYTEPGGGSSGSPLLQLMQQYSLTGGCL